MSSQEGVYVVRHDQLAACDSYRQLREAFWDLVCPETGTVDYASTESRDILEPIDEELQNLGFRRSDIKVIAAHALIDLEYMRRFLNYMEDPGDLIKYDQEA